MCIVCLTDDSHGMPGPIFSENKQTNKKKKQKKKKKKKMDMSSAAVVIRALLNRIYHGTDSSHV